MVAVPAKRLLEQLERGKLPPVVVLLGADSYWRGLCRRKLAEALVPVEARPWAVTTISAAGAEAGEVVARAQMQPMLAPRQVLFVADAEAWETGTENALKDTLAALTAYLDDPAPFTVLVLEAEKLDQRTRLARLLAERALVVELDAAGAGPARLAAEMARELGTEIEPAAAELLAASTAGQAARMAAELEKLACYAAGRPPITEADVRELVVPDGAAEVWEFAGLFASGERARALDLANELLRKGESGPRLVGALAWMYRKLMEAADLPAHTNEYQAARQLGMRPAAAAAALEQSRKIPRDQLRRGLVALAEADDRLKSASADDRAVLEFLLARLTRRPGASPPRP
ncbi:MAG TPA: DNA polymerase III subunit delta [Candidatus Acidoferrales bacterium]|nr:DNA polymerase III subunit delta [Candidatus Acidoferrales bacterium]